MSAATTSQAPAFRPSRSSSVMRHPRRAHFIRRLVLVIITSPARPFDAARVPQTARLTRCLIRLPRPAHLPLLPPRPPPTRSTVLSSNAKYNTTIAARPLSPALRRQSDHLALKTLASPELLPPPRRTSSRKSSNSRRVRWMGALSLLYIYFCFCSIRASFFVFIFISVGWVRSGAFF
jgi:hypothetical protein